MILPADVLLLFINHDTSKSVFYYTCSMVNMPAENYTLTVSRPTP